MKQAYRQARIPEELCSMVDSIVVKRSITGRVPFSQVLKEALIRGLRSMGTEVSTAMPPKTASLTNGHAISDAERRKLVLDAARSASASDTKPKIVHPSASYGNGVKDARREWVEDVTPLGELCPPPHTITMEEARQARSAEGRKALGRNELKRMGDEGLVVAMRTYPEGLWIESSPEQAFDNDRMTEQLKEKGL